MTNDWRSICLLEERAVMDGSTIELARDVNKMIQQVARIANMLIERGNFDFGFAPFKTWMQ
eukprot:1501931-Pyramimonas_sp.AAC.1